MEYGKTCRVAQQDNIVCRMRYKEHMSDWDEPERAPYSCSLDLCCIVGLPAVLADCAKIDRMWVSTTLHTLTCIHNAVSFLTYFSVINPYVPSCAQPGLLYLMALCVQAAETAEQSKED